MPRDVRGAVRMFLVIVLVGAVCAIAANLDELHGWLRVGATAVSVVAIYSTGRLLIQEGREQERRGRP